MAIKSRGNRRRTFFSTTNGNFTHTQLDGGQGTGFVLKSHTDGITLTRQPGQTSVVVARPEGHVGVIREQGSDVNALSVLAAIRQNLESALIGEKDGKLGLSNVIAQEAVRATLADLPEGSTETPAATPAT